MRRFLTACLLVLVATVATIDMVDCPDGCRSAGSQTAADSCNSPSQCMFCIGGVVVTSAEVVVEPVTAALTQPTLPVPAPPSRPADIPYHPPRHA